MAPFVGPTRQKVIEMLRGGSVQLPLLLGMYEPRATIDREDGAWVMRELVYDHEATQRLQSQLPPGTMQPEMQQRKPGRVIASAAGPAELADAIEVEVRPNRVERLLRALGVGRSLPISYFFPPG